MLSIVDNALLQGLVYAPAVLGVALAFRVIRYPDLTADGSFLLGGTIVAAAARSGLPIPTAVVLVILAGATAGALTGALHSWCRVNRLLSGILTSMACYSIGFRILGGRPNLGLLEHPTLFAFADGIDAARFVDVHPAAIFTSAIVLATLSVGVYVLLKSDMGLVLHTLGANERLVVEFGCSPRLYRMIGLSTANGLIAVSGALLTARQGFADVNTGTGIIVVLVAALVIGEEILRVSRWDPSRAVAARVLSSAVGGVAYSLMFLAVLRASTRGWLPFQLQPTDLKLISAALIVGVYIVRIKHQRSEELVPL